MVTYEIWEHEHLFEFAVRIEEGRVTGVCPISLDFACDPDGRLPELDYDTSQSVLFRFVEYPEQSCQSDPWLGGKCVPVRPGPLGRSG
jgi:hypothetical protein